MEKSNYLLKENKPVFCNIGICKDDKKKEILKLFSSWTKEHINPDERESFLKKSNWKQIRWILYFDFIDPLSKEMMRFYISKNKKNYVFYIPNMEEVQTFQFFSSIEEIKWEFGFSNVPMNLIKSHF